MTASPMSHAYVHGVGVAAPGLADWAAALPVLRGETEYRAEPLPAFRTSLLPRNESRRAGAGVRMAFRVAEQACSLEQAGGCATVFVSSAGDIDIAEALCSAVNTPERAVSPIRFHNSVHNAAAGYWSIATGSREPSNSLSGGMDGFAVALCEAWATLATSATPVLLVCFDCDGQGLLHNARPDIHGSFALALLLSREPSGARARISRPALTRDAASRCVDEQLEYFRRCNPSARALPVLRALAGTGQSQVIVESGQGNLAIEVR